MGNRLSRKASPDGQSKEGKSLPRDDRPSGQYFGAFGRLLDLNKEPPANPLLSPEFTYEHADKMCSYRDERLHMSEAEQQQIQHAVSLAEGTAVGNDATTPESDPPHDPPRDLQAELNRLSCDQRPMKIILDTDIGTDCDDALALLTCLNLPESDVELLGVTTNYHPTRLRAQVAEWILHAAGGRWANVPVFAGPSRPCGTHQPFFHNGNEGKGLGLGAGELKALWAEEAGHEAVDFLYQSVCKYPGEVLIVAIGTGTNIGLCAHRHPDFERNIGHIFFMGGGSLLTRKVWADRWKRSETPPFELPPDEATGLAWVRGSECKPVVLFPNINVSNDTLGTSLMLSCKCPITMIPHFITAEHWLEGPPIETLLALADTTRIDGQTATASGTSGTSEASEEEENSHSPDIQASILTGKLVLEWFKTRHGQRGQCLHDPLTVYEAVYPFRDDGADPGGQEEGNHPEQQPRGSCLKYRRGTIICHSWAGYTTFVPDPQGMHRLAVSCDDADAWTNSWVGPTLLRSIPVAMRCEQWKGRV